MSRAAPSRANALHTLIRGARQRPDLSPLRAYYILAVLFLVAAVNLMDRQILSILLVPIQMELGVSDSQMGLLTGFGFAVFYVTAAIPLARWADMGNRRNLIALAVGVWSVATMLCGAVTSYVQLLLTRIGVASGEAASGPAALSMISDLFPVHRRATAIGLYMIGAASGVFLGLFLGGVLNDLYGWRLAFVAVGAPGLLVGLLMWVSVPEPVRGVHDGDLATDPDSASAVSVLRYLAKLRTFPVLMLAIVLQQIVNSAWMVWTPAFLMRVHDMSAAEVGLWLGLAIGLGAGTGNLLGGVISDRMSGYGARWYLLVSALAILVAIPISATFIFAASRGLAIAAFLPFAFCMGCAFVPSTAAGLAIARPRMRAFVNAIIQFCTNLVGFGFGPLLIGVLNDRFAPTYGSLAIRYSFIVIPGLLAASGAAYLLASRSMDRDVARAG